MCTVFNVCPKKIQRSYLSYLHFFLPEHLEVSKIFILMCSFWAKYILFELKKYRGIIYHETEERYNIWRGRDLLFQNWHVEIRQNLTWALQNLKNFHFNWLLLSKLYILWAKKVQRYSFMKLKRDTKFEEESTPRFKIGVRNLTKFDPSTRKSQKFSF